MTYEVSLVILKPEALSRGLCGRIIEIFENKGLDIINVESLVLSPEQVVQQYWEYQQEGIKQNIGFAISKGPLITIALGGENCSKRIRQLIGFYKPEKGTPGSVRGRFMSSLKEGSIVHGSDNQIEAIGDIMRLSPRFYNQILSKKWVRK